MFSATKFTPTPKRIRREKTTVSSSSSDVERDPVHVYCRLRPLQETDSKSCMTLLSPQEICITNESKGTRRDISYKFKHIFTSLSTQKEIFDHVAYPLLEDLLKGKNGLLFTYGVTGSGKTYTLTGNFSYLLLEMCMSLHLSWKLILVLISYNRNILIDFYYWIYWYLFFASIFLICFNFCGYYFVFLSYCVACTTTKLFVLYF